jgi:hypothetical protein
MSTELALLSTSSPIALRSAVVLEQILAIKSTLMKRALELGRLLKEARDNQYNLTWGFARFGDWVEEASGLDMSARYAYDLIKLIEQSGRLGIPDEVLERGKISKLKTIFTLKDGEMTDDEIRALVLEAETSTLKKITAKVNEAKELEWEHRTYKFDKTAYDEVVLPAINKVIRIHGDTLSEEGGTVDISDSKAIELIAAEYNAGPESAFDDIPDGEFRDFDDLFQVGSPLGIGA